jgi:hypothetical protein
VPTDPVSIAVALADKLDTLVGFWAIDEKPTGSKDPYAALAPRGIRRWRDPDVCVGTRSPSRIANSSTTGSRSICAIPARVTI